MMPIKRPVNATLKLSMIIMSLKSGPPLFQSKVFVTNAAINPIRIIGCSNFLNPKISEKRQIKPRADKTISVVNVFGF